MKQHIEIENDPRVWDAISSLIETKISVNAVSATGG
jgi:hypothetical protein